MISELTFGRIFGIFVFKQLLVQPNFNLNRITNPMNESFRFFKNFVYRYAINVDFGNVYKSKKIKLSAEGKMRKKIFPNI